MVIGYDEKGLPKTKNVLAKTKGECVEKRKALKAAITLPVPTKTKADMTVSDFQRLYTWKKTDGRSQNRETHVAGLFDGEIIF